MIGVLVVDDDFMVAGIHARFVEKTAGFTVVGTARNGEEALRLVDELAPDLILLDVHLPDMSGLEVLQRLRASGNVAGVVMVTADRDADVVRKALHGGAMQYLVKPFEYPDLATRLLRVRDTLALLERGSRPTRSRSTVRSARRSRRTSRCPRASATRPRDWSARRCVRPASCRRPSAASGSGSHGSVPAATSSTSSTTSRPSYA